MTHADDDSRAREQRWIDRLALTHPHLPDETTYQLEIRRRLEQLETQIERLNERLDQTLGPRPDQNT
jgi:hypothetical protein